LGGCDQICRNFQGYRTCLCRMGYILNTVDLKTCDDKNECLSNNGGCDANAACVNTVGSRTCTCNANFTGDGIVCAPATAY
jgi:hypothetical protein